MSKLIHQKSVAGRIGVSLPTTKLSQDQRDSLIPETFRRSESPSLPEVSEGDVMRHYIALSVDNFHIDKGFYPLGSCTMKYNPKRNDTVAFHRFLRESHPQAPVDHTQGSLRILFELQELIGEITGFDNVSLQPVAGAQGEMTGISIMRAFHEHLGAPRRKILIPDSAHGTNPATVTLSGFQPVEIRSNKRGILSAATVKEALDKDTAGVMITNPNTLGLFESEILEIVEAVHSAGALLYMDGANLNAQLGVVRPGEIGFDMLHINMHKTFSTPHGGGGPGAGALCVNSRLEPFLPRPIVSKRESKSGDNSSEFYLDLDRPLSIGRVHSFYGNFSNLVRAWAYIRTLGAVGLSRVTENAIINANYLRCLLSEAYEIPYPGICQHEVVVSAIKQKRKGARAADISKRLLDYGYHSPTTYFPLIVAEAMMIEPTETESRETLDSFAEAMIAIAKEIDENPELVRTAPHNTSIKRLDEGKAARELDVALL